MEWNKENSVKLINKLLETNSVADLASKSKLAVNTFFRWKNPKDPRYPKYPTFRFLETLQEEDYER